MECMDRVKSYLTRNGVNYRGQDPRLLIFGGNVPNGIYIERDDFSEKVRKYLNRKNSGVTWEWRGNYSSVYVKPVQVE